MAAPGFCCAVASGLSLVPISDDPALVGRLIRQFLDDAEHAPSRRADLIAARV